MCSTEFITFFENRLYYGLQNSREFSFSSSKANESYDIDVFSKQLLNDLSKYFQYNTVNITNITDTIIAVYIDYEMFMCIRNQSEINSSMYIWDIVHIRNRH